METRIPSYIDLHTHLFSPDPLVWAIRSFHQREKREAGQYLGPHSAGLHPWFLEPDLFEEDWDWVERESARPETVALGEAGLDRLQGPPLPFQEMVFLKHIRLAETRNKPLIVHCVRAWEELERLLRTQAPAIPVVVHGFQKNEDTMARLMPFNAFFSFGAAIFREGSTAERTFRAVPPDRFFLETDDDQSPIQAIYSRAAALREMEEASLIQQIHLNLQKIGIYG